MRIRHGYHPKNCAIFFVMAMVKINCAHGCFRKEQFTIYWVLGNLLEKIIVRFEFQMIVIRLPFKQPLGMGVWSKYGKKLELAAKLGLTKCFLMTSWIWIINAYIHSHRRN